MGSDLFHSVTFWLVLGVMAAAGFARLLHFWSVGDSFFAAFRERARAAQIDQAAANARQRFREGADPTWEDDLNDALHSSSASFDDDRKYALPGLEKMPESWPPPTGGSSPPAARG